MDPEIGRWMRQCWGEDAGTAKTMNTLSLKTIVQRLLPERSELLAKHHSAGADAALHRATAYAICGLSRAPCRMPGGGHQLTKHITEQGHEVLECSCCLERF